MSSVKDKQWLRITIFILVQPFVPPTGILPIIIHESAHWLTAFFSGVPISEIKFVLLGINPGVSIPLSTPPEVLPYFFYSGGLASATVLFLIYVFYWTKQYYRYTSLAIWIMGLFTAISVIIQLYLGVIEGRYHQTYPTHLYDPLIFVFFFVGIICHTLIFYIMSYFRKKRLRRSISQ